MNALLAPRPQRFRNPVGFLIVAALVYLIDGAIVHSPLFLERPDLFSAAVSFDLTLGVTFIYWLLVVRPGHAALRSTLPVFGVTVLAALITMPAGHRDFVRDVRYLGLPIEMGVIALVIVGVRRANARLRAAGTELDVPERIRAVLQSSVPPRAADIVAMEISIFYYALASWRRRPFAPSGAQSFSYHKRTGRAGILYTLVAVLLVETMVLDLVLRVHHPLAANILLGLDVFGAVWLLGFARAVQLRPIFVTPATLAVRAGLQWSVDIPRSAIDSIQYGHVKAPPSRTAEYLGAAQQPNVMIVLKEPMRARGAYGMERTISRVGLTIDDLERFRTTLSA